MKVFLLGSTGNSGRRIPRLALQRAYEVTAFVRDETKLLSLVDRPIPPNLHVSVGDISKSADIAMAMVGHDVAINAAGNVTEVPPSLSLYALPVPMWPGKLEFLRAGFSKARSPPTCQ